MLTEAGARSLVNGELQRSEQVLWQGRPNSDRWFYPQDILAIPFSVMWCGFAIFWEASALSRAGTRATVFFPLWGIPFVCIGLYMLIGRFFVRHWMLSGTVYALTDRRALTITPGFRGQRHVNSVWLGSFPPVQKRIGSDGRGTIRIGTFPTGARSFSSDPGWPGSGRMTGSGVIFTEIDRPAQVYELLTGRLSRQAAAHDTA